MLGRPSCFARGRPGNHDTCLCACTASGVQESWFRLGQEFKVKYGSKVFGVKHKVCDLNGTNVLIW